MSNWDDDDWDDSPAPAATAVPAAAPLPTTGLGDWDDEDLEETEEPVVKKDSAPMKPKKALELALKTKEKEEGQREIARIKAREQELEMMTAVERKLREQTIIEEADLENVNDLFSGVSKSDVKMTPPANPTLDTFEPKTDADFEKLAHMIGEKCCTFNDNPRKTSRYVQFIKFIMRDAAKDLNADDTKDLEKFMGILRNEKIEEFKKSKGIKKKVNKKAHVRVDRAGDIRDNAFDDFADDFM